MPESGLFRLSTIDQRVVVRGEGRDLFAAPVGSVGSVAIVGGPSDDVLELGDYAGNYSYDTGGGSDTLRLVTQGRVVDLTRSTPDVPRGLAAIDLRGTGSNRVLLDPTSAGAIWSMTPMTSSRSDRDGVSNAPSSTVSPSFTCS
jgi:hypothetical protein